MVDDLVCVSACGPKTAMLNAFLNHKTSSKKLQFGVNKCKKLHVGKVRHEHKCQDLMVEKWEEIKLYNDENDLIEEDIFVGDYKMEEKYEERYLGDIISTDGKNIKNIKARVTKGKYTINRIFTILDAIPLGRRYYEVGILLRDCLLVSSMLFNSEAWYNISKSELELLEAVDIIFLRKLINAPRGTPKEILYLEMGCIPFRELILERRLRFLYYILNQKEDSMVYRFLKSQIRNRTKKDWVTTVFEDLKYLNMEHRSLEEIKNMKQVSFERIVKERIHEKTLERLKKLKNSHSKVKDIDYEIIKIQKYLQPNNINISREETQLIFKLRCRVTGVKTNMRNMYSDVLCDACGIQEESQKHVIQECIKLNENQDNMFIYEKIYNGSVSEKVEIAKKFEKNYQKLQEHRNI